MGEIKKEGDEPSGVTKLETVVEARKLEEELLLIEAAVTEDDDHQTDPEETISYTRSSRSDPNLSAEDPHGINPGDFGIFAKWFKTNVRSYINTNYAADGVHHQHQTGFYKIPDDMLSSNTLTRAEEMKVLYQPATNANFRNISNLLKNIFGSMNDLDSLLDHQLRHYYYHLISYADHLYTTFDVLMKEALRKQEKIAKSWYPEDIEDDHDHEKQVPFNINVDDSNRNSLALLLASCFLGDMFTRDISNQLSFTEDPECAHLWVSELWADLLLLQNQIPFYFIRDGIDSVLIYLYFSEFLPMNRIEFLEMTLIPPLDEEKVLSEEEISRNNIFSTHDIHPLHLLHLVHHMLLPCKRKHQAVPSLFASVKCRLPMFDWTDGESRFVPPTMYKPVPTATRLQQAGVTFRPLYLAGFSVEFKNGVLKLPFLHITKCTKKFLLNLIAWEKTHRDAPKYFINYVIFMDHLINTSKDVEILIQSRVFEHSLPTDEAVAALFNGLGQNLVYTKDDRYDIFPQLSFDLNKYCQSRSNMWRANLMQDYFKSPWTIISFSAALLLIMLTVAQTFFSAYSYFRPPK